jgi:hypothetical protein
MWVRTLLTDDLLNVSLDYKNIADFAVEIPDPAYRPGRRAPTVPLAKYDALLAEHELFKRKFDEVLEEKKALEEKLKSKRQKLMDLTTFPGVDGDVKAHLNDILLGGTESTHATLKLEVDGLKRHSGGLYIRNANRFKIRLTGTNDDQVSLFIVNAHSDDPPVFVNEGITGAIFMNTLTSGINSFKGTATEISQLRSPHRAVPRTPIRIKIETDNQGIIYSLPFRITSKDLKVRN